jgi:hypothetical protein
MRNNAAISNKRNDKRRLQSMISLQELQILGLDLQLLCEVHGVWIEGDAIAEPSFLASLEGCKPQLWHQDYLDFPIGTANNDVARSCILAVQAFEILVKDDVYNRRSDDGVDERLVHVPKGALLVFRGDLLHAGGGSSVDCTRLHWFLDKPEVPGGRHPSGTVPSKEYYS